VSSLVDIFIHHTSRFPPILYLKRSGLVGISIAPSKGMNSSSSARSLAPLLAITLICLGWSPVILVFLIFLHTTFLSCFHAHDQEDVLGRTGGAFILMAVVTAINLDVAEY
jgi:hypothetical protein